MSLGSFPERREFFAQCFEIGETGGMRDSTVFQLPLNAAERLLRDPDLCESAFLLALSTGVLIPVPRLRPSRTTARRAVNRREIVVGVR
jgi:hypothetical protein